MSESSRGFALNRLPSSTIKLISSSQVILSVSSVVKELMENSLDAGASFLEVHLDGHGLDRIEVKDNGKGIPTQEVPYMCQRSYTSKISEFSDLDNLSSYGFRGEALFSVCTVADVSVTTISSGDTFGRTYKMNHNGEVVDTKPANIDRGTSIVVTNLFKNLPIRKLFLSSGKRKAEELKKVETIVKSLGLVNCSVKIRFTHNKLTIWQKASVCSILQSFLQVLSPTVVKQLKEIMFVDELEKIEFTLLVPKLDCNILTTCLGHTLPLIYLFVNQRPVREKQIEKVIHDKVFEFFGTKIPAKKYPAMLASIILPPDMIDVNLEPNKTKVMVKNIEKVTKLLNDQLSIYYYGKDDETKMEEVRAIEPLKRKVIPASSSQSSKKLKKDFVEESSTEPDNSLNVGVVVTVDDSPEVLDSPGGMISSENQRGADVQNSVALSKSTSALEPFMKSTTVHESVQIPISAPVVNSASLQIPEAVHNSSATQCAEQAGGVLFDTDMIKGNTTYSTIEPREVSTAAVAAATTTAEHSKSTTVSTFLDGIESRSLPSARSTETNQKTVDGSSKLIVGDNPFDLLTTHRITEKCEDKSDFFSDCWFEDPWVNVAKSPEKPNFIETPSSLIKSINEKSSKQNEDLEEFSLSCWSRGDVSINGKTLEGTTSVVGAPMIDDTAVSLSSDRDMSNQTGHKGMSAFSKFAKQMRVEIVKAEPGMSFPKIAKELSRRWQELQEEDRKTYEEMAAADKLKNRNRVQTTKDLKPPERKSEKCKPLLVKRYHTVEKVEVNLSDIRERSKSRSSKVVQFSDESPEIVAHINEDLSLVKGKSTINVVSIGRLTEAVKFYNNLSNMTLKLRVLEEGVEITKTDLGPMWDVLETLTSGTNVNIQGNQAIPSDVITDERITKNGFKIEKVESSSGTKFTITEVAQNIAHLGVEDLHQVLQCISKNNHCHLRDCRPLAVINSIRSETILSTACQTFTRTDYSVDLYKFWCRKIRNRQDLCPHHRPVAQQVFPLN